MKLLTLIARMFVLLGIAFALPLLHAPESSAVATTEMLSKQFVTPPASARPWVYWFWIDGSITREGITADIEAMARVGVGGVLIMEVAQTVPAGPVAFASPEWRELFKHAVTEASRLGIEVNMNNDAGWCGSGGPWNTPEHAMQKVVWSEMTVDGPQPFQGKLPQPLTVEGYYHDIAVLAFPTPSGELGNMSEMQPALTLNNADSAEGIGVLLDGNPDTHMLIQKPVPNKAPRILLEFPQPFEARTAYLAVAAGHGRVQVRIQVSEDGNIYRTIREFDFSTAGSSVSFPATTSKYWALEINRVDSREESLALGEVRLGPEFRIENADGKSGRVYHFPGLPTKDNSLPADFAVDRNQIVDITSSMAGDGQMNWQVPAGRWTIMRFGHTPTGSRNAPAPASGTGLECDKLSKEAVEAHFNGFMKKLIDDCGPLVGKDGAGLTMTHIDSWEVGSQNWTPRFRQDFLERRGYDPLPWLPVVTGRAITNAEVSERFLWDMRRTIGELVADNYAGHLRALSNRNGIKLSIEAYGDCIFDNLAYAGRADVPMSEFWMGGGAMQLGKAMSSAAHTYGHPIIAAESFTAAEQAGRWMQHPFSIKELGDQSFCEGVNRFVFHRYAMQPWLNRAPGMTMGPWGIHYERTETWWEKTGPWHAYLSRCQFLLQAGRFAADACYCIGEGVPNDATPRANLNPPLPAGYDFDSATAEIVMQMEVRDGMLTLPGGMVYRVLVLPPSDRMTPVLLRKVKALVDAGATVVGTPPERSPGLANYPACDEEVRTLAAALWNTSDAGKNRVLANVQLEKVFSDMKLRPDFMSNARLRYIHRIIGDTDAYFVANSLSHSVDAVCGFRVSGKRPEIWHPDTGEMERVAVYEERDGMTRLPVRLDASGSAFVVFLSAETREEPILSVSLDGQEILPGKDLMPKLNILKAVYGIQNNPELCRDVRPEIQQLVDEGARQLRVCQLAQGADPAHMQVKTLVIEYMAGDQRITVSGQDNDTVELPDYASQVIINKARYGLLTDPAATRDVRAKAQRLVDSGVRVFPVTRMADGDDPAVGIVKTLEMDYVIDGREVSISKTDSETVTLDMPPVPEKARTATVTRNTAGAVLLEAWQPGHYEIKMPSGKTVAHDVAPLSEPLEITGAWEVSFAPNWGAPDKVMFNQLVSWSEHENPGIKYFSGTAVYRKTVSVPSELLSRDRRIYLDLGQVAIMAQLKINGKDLGILWKPPFTVDVTDAVQAGDNFLEIEVVNLWVNRLIGDEQLPEDTERYDDGALKIWPEWLQQGKPSPSGRYTFATWRLWKKDSELVPSGLLGPVRLLTTSIGTLSDTL